MWIVPSGYSSRVRRTCELLYACKEVAFFVVEGVVKGDDRAARAWALLVDKYQVKSASRGLEMRRQYANLVIAADEDPDDFIQRAEFLRRSMEECGVGLNQNVFVGDIVIKLHEPYSELVTTIEHQLEDLTVSDLQAKLRTFYTRKIVAVPPAAAAHAARVPQGSSSQPAASSGRPQCTHCHKVGHSVDNCFQLNGTPAGWTPKKKAFGRARKGSGRKNGDGAAGGINVGFMLCPTLRSPLVRTGCWTLELLPT
jgi:gag-polypeptide of LTR copia-type